MPGKIVLGAQWGDEGKGKYIDIFASQADLVVRSQGGNNAGHTVVVGDESYKLQLIPSGILYPDCVNVIGPGVVVNPKSILGEIDGLNARGISTDKLYIDARAHCILPWHLELDALSEKARGGDDIGTTRKGIGPTYMDKSERIGVRMHDFVDPDRFEAVMTEACARKNKVITGVYGGEPIDIQPVLAEYRVYAERLRSHVCDTSVLTYNAVKAGKEVLFEGAQGTLLDLDMGTYPYVTSSHPISGGCCVGSGVGPTAIDEVVGICKSYTTRVGKGPFPTELFDETGDYIRNAGGEFGTVTGRPRRTGWFDAVIARYAVRVNGLTEMVINKIDPLCGLPKLKVCVAYDFKGERITEFPANFADLEHCTPIYEEFDGFTEDITGCKTFDELPANVRNYIKQLEKIIECPVRLLGVGPGRDQVIAIDK
ncbi:MAG TPA: adenylosuccinate synthase [Candidatus Butyricicoccus stercorigallinarum]|nr:adenylosuccinate synthase [Candidatus Butyricicoccus stercorigallinarum]